MMHDLREQLHGLSLSDQVVHYGRVINYVQIEKYGK